MRVESAHGFRVPRQAAPKSRPTLRAEGLLGLSHGGAETRCPTCSHPREATLSAARSARRRPSSGRAPSEVGAPTEGGARPKVVPRCTFAGARTERQNGREERPVPSGSGVAGGAAPLSREGAPPAPCPRSASVPSGPRQFACADRARLRASRGTRGSDDGKRRASRRAGAAKRQRVGSFRTRFPRSDWRTTDACCFRRS